ncbi:hypothetical protein TY91_06845 [Secundilactobacillus collinoides]|uniref:Uncharacterized protein n=1 Tax=Secundilactobacillus collinoides TaxID=33960 RepID=A0A166H546_SECCO|nr:hypothetical protein TY91_06845 [Secundilactobacillus collinoides]
MVPNRKMLVDALLAIKDRVVVGIVAETRSARQGVTAYTTLTKMPNLEIFARVVHAMPFNRLDPRAVHKIFTQKYYFNHKYFIKFYCTKPTFSIKYKRRLGLSFTPKSRC